MGKKDVEEVSDKKTRISIRMGLLGALTSSGSLFIVLGLLLLLFAPRVNAFGAGSESFLQKTAHTYLGSH